MNLTEFIKKGGAYFIAMEYYWLILNRTFLILITKNHLIGLQVNGLIGVESDVDIFSIIPVVADNLSNPHSYLSQKYIDDMADFDLSDDRILQKNKTNFSIKRCDIKAIYHNPAKKFGMGNYPHDGRVYIETIDGKTREFILLGNQSGEKVVQELQKVYNEF